jgi:hypothetical protein
MFAKRIRYLFRFLLVVVFLCSVSLAVYASFRDVPRFGKQIDCGVISNHHINEASGLAASRRNPGVLWTHNDSGDRSRIFAIDTQGGDLAEFRLQKCRLRDWEDIAVGPGPVPGRSYIYIADIGDNEASQETKEIHRFPEPSVNPAVFQRRSKISGFETMRFRYPDGPRDAETLMVDPFTTDIFVVSKRDKHVRVYQAKAPLFGGPTITIEKIASLPLTDVVAGDISPDGLEMLLKTYTGVYYYNRDVEESWAEALQQQPRSVPYTPEFQGEAVCWNVDGTGYYTLSEEVARIPARLYFYSRMDNVLGAVRKERPAKLGSRRYWKERYRTFSYSASQLSVKLYHAMLSRVENHQKS